MNKIPKNHPRYNSLITREIISNAIKKGLVHETGLIAHGRGEAFDYIIGEKTLPHADESEKIAAAALLTARDPVISINGNVVALVSKEIISLSNIIPAKLEVNLFHRTKKRMENLTRELKKNGASKVFGLIADARIPGLNHDRGLCYYDGIFSSDVILVPLEDGDRCEALKNMGKTVIAIDLNPLSRTSKCASITIVDNVIRAIPNIEKWVKILKHESKSNLSDLVKRWDNKKNLKNLVTVISKNLDNLY